MDKKLRTLLKKIAQPTQGPTAVSLQQPAQFYATTINTLAISQEFADFVRKQMAQAQRPLSTLTPEEYRKFLRVFSKDVVKYYNLLS